MPEALLLLLRWRTNVQKPRQRSVVAVVDEIVDLRRRGFRFIALADDNFYPATLADLAMAERQRNAARLEQLRTLRAERFELMDRWHSCARIWCNRCLRPEYHTLRPQ